MRALAAGGKYLSVYFLPSASPSMASVASTQRFQRGLFSVVPFKYLPLNAKSSSTNGCDSDDAAELTTCQVRYVRQSATDVALSWCSTSVKNLGWVMLSLAGVTPTVL